MARKKTKNHEGRGADHPSASTLLQSAIKGSGISFLATVPISLIGAFVCSSISDPSVAIASIGTGAALLCYLLSGILSSRNAGASPLLCGFLSGGILSLFLLILGCLTGGFSFSSMGWLLKFLGMGFSLMGAYLANGRTTAPRRKKRHSHGRS